MNATLFLYILNTVLLIVPIIKQFLIVARSPHDDKKVTLKTMILIFSLSMMAAMWLCYFSVRSAGGFFFLIAILVIVWTYKDEKFKNKK
jgi:hypothetical protein